MAESMTYVLSTCSGISGLTANPFPEGIKGALHSVLRQQGCLGLLQRQQQGHRKWMQCQSLPLIILPQTPRG